MKHDLLVAQTGLSPSTIYRRLKQNYSKDDIIAEAKIMKEHKSAGSNWKKVYKKARGNTDIVEQKISAPLSEETNKLLEETNKKERKIFVHWEPADDYGLISRLKVLGGWIIKVEDETLFVTDPAHKWEV